ncbi:MAG: aminotransferase class V-fold PLP-dependent enzyme [Firmicutes bacterium]|nr:aminotransferase class V-fold PLP-dependent enzyme [Bacillota bacterium]
MNQYYLDNASTSFPKPAPVADAVYQYMTGIGANVNRGGYESAYSAAEMVFECRQLLAELFGAEDCKNVVFTKNITESLNVVLKGFLKPGDHVLVSSMEHNAMMRPIVQLAKQGVEFDRMPCREDGSLIVEEIEKLIRPNTRAICMLHASNICGTVLPAPEVGAICQKHGLKFILDVAQTAGVTEINMQTMHIDALCFTGHKSLLGPQGIGGFILKEDMIAQIEPLISGGTGSISHSEEVPEFMPDRFEPGTMNLPGIMGLRAALLWHKEQPKGSVLAHELQLTQAFLDGMKPLEEAGLIRIAGKKDCEDRLAVVSIQSTQTDPAELAFRLDSEYGIMTRVGLHCAPNAHKTLGTYPEGTVRFSFGFANTMEEIAYAVKAIGEILNGN